MQEDLIDQIYEAAFVPELWPGVLDEIGTLTQSVGGVLFAIGGGTIPRWTASAAIEDAFSAFLTDPEAPPPRAPLQLWLRSWNLGWEVGTTIPMPSGETVAIGLERPYAAGPHGEGVLATLDGFRPHLARATLIAARLGLERAQATVSTLEAIGLPAAVLSASGRALAVNGLLEAAPECVAGALGRLILSDPEADRLFRMALDAQPERGACSVPIPAVEGRPRGIVHAVPLHGAAHDLFGGSTLLVLTRLSQHGNIPEASLLHGLFDLTPKEARLAAGLAAGGKLKDVADAEQLQLSTARSYLESILRKTGTGQQSQLVALLKGARWIAPALTGNGAG